MNYELAWFSLKESLRIVKNDFTSKTIRTDDMANIIISAMDNLERKHSKEENSGL